MSASCKYVLLVFHTIIPRVIFFLFLFFITHITSNPWINHVALSLKYILNNSFHLPTMLCHLKPWNNFLTYFLVCLLPTSASIFPTSHHGVFSIELPVTLFLQTASSLTPSSPPNLCSNVVTCLITLSKISPVLL